MRVYKPPIHLIALEGPIVFLAGSIEMGDAPEWRAEMEAFLSDESGSLLNPRRDDWDSSWQQSMGNFQFVEQVEWELTGLEVADVVALYLAPGTKSPISLLELGSFIDKCIVYCPEGFWRKGNVDIFCDRYGLPAYHTLDAWKLALLGAL